MKRARRRSARYGRYGRHGTWRGAEHRREREEAVEVNIPPHLLSLWRRTRRQFRGTPHQRYEQFMHYAEEHAGELSRAVQDDADAAVDRMIRERERNDARAGDRYSEAGRTLAELRWSMRFP